MTTGREQISPGFPTGLDPNLPVVACADADGRVRLKAWAELDRLADAPAWSLGSADVRTAISGSLLVTGDALGEVRLWDLEHTEPRQIGEVVRPHQAPITAVALVDVAGRGFAVTGDSGGTVAVSPFDRGGLDHRPLRRMQLNSKVLSIATLTPTKSLIWCRQGSLVIEWTLADASFDEPSRVS